MKILLHKKRITLQWVSILFFFLTILLKNEVDNLVTTLLYYGSMILCVIALRNLHKRVLENIHLLICGTLVFGGFNIVFIGNNTVIRLTLVVLGFFIAELFLSHTAPANAFLASVIINTVFIIYKVAKYGVGSNVYLAVSNNYISIFLLAPLLIYYVKKEMYHCAISIKPAIIVWVMCFIGGGRGGLLVASFLLCCLLFYRYKKMPNVREKFLISFIFPVFVITAATVLLPVVINHFGDYRVVSRFMEIGFNSDSRLRMWREYFELLKDSKYLLLGGPLGEVFWAAKFYNGNLHNSFLMVHAFFGLGGFIAIVIMMMSSFKFAVQQQRWIFIICFIAFCMRAFTDHVFGCYRLTPVFLFFLLYPIAERKGEMKEGEKCG